MIEKFEEWLRTYAEKWLSAIKEHEDSVANFYMSPETFFKIWQNKDSYTQPRKHLKINLGAGIVIEISATIRNHFSNRPPNWNDPKKKKEKINYFFGIVSYAREYNFLPISMIINKKGEKQFDTLIGKDRGTTNFFMSKMHDKIPLKFWKSFINFMKAESQDLIDNKPRFKSIYDNINKLINDGKPSFTMRDCIPTEVWERWYNDENFFNLRLKFEYYDSSTGDMVRYNNITNPWINHNKIKGKVITPMVVKFPNTYTEQMLDDIYAVCKVEPLLMGHLNNILNPPNNNVEESEEILIWMFTGLKGKEDHEVVAILARDTNSNFEKLKKAYQSAFESGVSSFEDSVDYFKWVSENPSLEKYNKAHTEFIAKHYPNQKKKDMHPNLTELKTVGWVNYLMIVKAVIDICLDTQNGRISKDRISDVTTKFFQNAISLFDDKDVLKKLTSQNGGTEARYLDFFKIAKMKTIDKIQEEASKGYDMNVLYKISQDYLEESGYSTKKFIIYDRVSPNEFKEFEVDFYNHNCEKGHLIPTKPLQYGNVITQTPDDNAYNNNHPIDDLQDYITKYGAQLETWYKNNNLGTDESFIKHKTMIWLESLVKQGEKK